MEARAKIIIGVKLEDIEIIVKIANEKGLIRLDDHDTMLLKMGFDTDKGDCLIIRDNRIFYSLYASVVEFHKKMNVITDWEMSAREFLEMLASELKIEIEGGNDMQRSIKLIKGVNRENVEKVLGVIKERELAIRESICGVERLIEQFNDQMGDCIIIEDEQVFWEHLELVKPHAESNNVKIEIEVTAHEFLENLPPIKAPKEEYIITGINKENIVPVLEKLEAKGIKWNSGDLATQYNPYKGPLGFLFDVGSNSDHLVIRGDKILFSSKDVETFKEPVFTVDKFLKEC